MTQPTQHRPAPSLAAAGALALVETLPPWRVDLDDDPAWLTPVRDLGLEHATTPLDLRRSVLNDLADDTRPTQPVPVDLIVTASQPWVRLDALAHYLRSPDTRFDQDGWYSDHPVLYRRDDGTYRILDGTTRAAAAILRGDGTIDAQVLDSADLHA